MQKISFTQPLELGKWSGRKCQAAILDNHHVAKGASSDFLMAGVRKARKDIKNDKK